MSIDRHRHLDEPTRREGREEDVKSSCSTMIVAALGWLVILGLAYAWLTGRIGP